MYTLRTIMPNGVESNQSLGEFYCKIDKALANDEFVKSFKTRFKFSKEHYDALPDLGEDKNKDKESDVEVRDLKELRDKTYAFIAVEGGAKLIPLYDDRIYYVMTKTGTTFANLTY